MNFTFFKKFPDFSSIDFNENVYYNTYLNSSVLINASSKNAEFPENPGGPLTIKYVFKGEEFYLSNKRIYRVNRNNFLLFNRSQKYSSYINSIEETESFSVFFQSNFVSNVLSTLLLPHDKLLEKPDDLKRNSLQFNFIETLYPVDNSIVPALAELRYSMMNKSYPDSYYNEKLYFLLEEILKVNRKYYGNIENVQAVKSSTRIEVYRRLCIARDYIESTREQKISLSRIAKASCMCEHHLLREFRKYYKLTPYQYIIKTRLHYAKSLLATTEMPVSEISAESGFEYLSSFSQAFCRYFKISPTAYRSMNIKKVNFK